MQVIPGYQLVSGDMNLKQFPTSYLLMVGTDGTPLCFNNSKVPKSEMTITKNGNSSKERDHRHGVMWQSVSTDTQPPGYYKVSRTDNSLTRQYFGVNESGEAMAGGGISLKSVAICRHRWLYQSFFPHDFPKPTIEHLLGHDNNSICCLLNWSKNLNNRKMHHDGSFNDVSGEEDI